MNSLAESHIYLEDNSIVKGYNEFIYYHCLNNDYSW